MQELSGADPLVSVVIPAYNSAEFIRDCIDSVIGQDYRPLEIIIVDNDSTDATREILQSYPSDCIRLLVEKKRGAAAARNAGVLAARGDFLAFQDADDVWLPGKLRAQVAYLREYPDVGIVFGQFAHWTPVEGLYPPPSWFVSHPESWEIGERLDGWIYVETLLSNPIAMNTPLIRRTVWEEVGPFDETLAAGSDYEFWLRATAKSRAHKLDNCLALYRHHGDGITAKVRMQSTMAQIIERALKDIGPAGPDGRSATPAQLAQRFMGLWLDFGKLHLERGNIPTGVRAMINAGRNAQSIGPFVLSLLRMAPGAVKGRAIYSMETLRRSIAGSGRAAKARA